MGLFEVIKMVDEINYILNTQGHRKTRHVNMLKKYHQHPLDTSGEKEVL